MNLPVFKFFLLLSSETSMKNRRQITLGRSKGKVTTKNFGGKRDIVHKVTIKNSGRGDIDFVLNSISELIGSILPFSINEDAHQNVSFYVYTKEVSFFLAHLFI